MAQRPIVNEGQKYLFGLRLSRPDTATIQIEPGGARDNDNIVDIEVSSNILISTAKQGANGIDNGILSPNTLYSVYVLGDSTRHNESAGILSTNFIGPQLPAGYDVYRRVGACLTIPSMEIFNFFQTGSGKDRRMDYQLGFSVLNGGNSVSYVEVDLSSIVPPVICQVVLFSVYTPASAPNNVILRPFGTGSLSFAGSAQFGSGAVGAQHSTQLVQVGLDNGVPKIEYRTFSGDSLDLGVIGYIDQL